MLDLFVKATRIGVIVFWVALVLSLISVIPRPYSSYVIWIGGWVLLIHLLEYFYVKAKFPGQDSVEISFVQTMLFGFTYWLPLFVNDRGTKL
jgi:uncharacterized protein YhhL (DUF1145 family)